MKIGVFICGDVAERCTANGCFKAYNNKVDAFESDQSLELVAFNNCIGCDKEPVKSLDLKIEKFLKAGVERIHLSTCIRGRCQNYETFAEKLSHHFDVVGYTHGSALGKKENNINIKKRQSL